MRSYVSTGSTRTDHKFSSPFALSLSKGANSKKITMLNKKFLLLLTLLSAHMCAQQTPSTSIITNPTFNNNPPITTTISPQFITNTTSTINAVGVQMKDVALTILQKAQETFTKENYNSAKSALKTLLWEYRYKIAAGTIIGAYSGTNILLLHDYYYLKDAQRWACWKSDCNFELLCAIPHTDLTQELIRSIGEYHYNKKNPNDATHPLITFIATIEREIKTCKRYLHIAKTIQQLHLTKIFPINDSKMSEVNQFLEKCLFIRHLFLSWLTERTLMTKGRRFAHFNPHKVSIRSIYCN